MAEGGLHPRPHRRRVLRDRGGPGARQEVQARHRSGGRPHRRPRRHRDAAGRQLRDRAEARRGPGLSRSGGSAGGAASRSACGEGRLRSEPTFASAAPRERPSAHRADTLRPHGGAERWRTAPSKLAPASPPAASSSPRNSPARSPASPSPRSSRACSPSTRRRAPARPATASARSWCSTRTSSSPTTRSRSRRARSCPGPSPTRPALITCRCSAASPAPTASTSTRPGATCPRRRSDVILHGTDGQPGHPALHRRRASYEVKKPFEGVIGNLNRRMLQTESAWMREELSRYQSAPPVRGLPRRPPQARGAGGEDRRRGHLHVHPPQSVADAYAWFARAPREAHPDRRTRSPSAILKEINERLGFLHNVGLDYLHLDRTSGTLSRRREPAHPPRQPDRLRPLGRALRPRRAARSASTRRTTTACSKRSSACATSATPCSSSSMTRTRSATPTMSSTWAPAPASTAARSSAQGTLDELLACETSITADYLSGRREIPLRATPPQGQRQVRSPSTAPPPTTSQDVTAAFPLGTFTCVTGVSGSRQVVAHHRHALRRRRARAQRRPHPLPARTSKITGLEQLDKVIDIDQSPIGRTPRSNPATYTGAFTQIRDWFAGLPESQGARLQARPLQLQRQGRPLRGVPGRRPDQDRDALPARRLRHLRRLPRRPLQPRDAGGEVQGPVASPTCST